MEHVSDVICYKIIEVLSAMDLALLLKPYQNAEDISGSDKGGGNSKRASPASPAFKLNIDKFFFPDFRVIFKFCLILPTSPIICFLLSSPAVLLFRVAAFGETQLPYTRSYILTRKKMLKKDE